MKFTTFLREAEDQVNQPEQPQQLELPLAPQPAAARTRAPAAPQISLRPQPKYSKGLEEYLASESGQDLSNVMGGSDNEEGGQRLRRLINIMRPEANNPTLEDYTSAGDMIGRRFFNKNLTDRLPDFIEGNPNIDFQNSDVFNRVIDAYDDLSVDEADEDNLDRLKGLFQNINFNGVNKFPLSSVLQTYAGAMNAMDVDTGLPGLGIGSEEAGGLNNLIEKFEELGLKNDTINGLLGEHMDALGYLTEDRGALGLRQLLTGYRGKEEEPNGITLEGFLGNNFKTNLEELPDSIQALSKHLQDDLGGHPFFNASAHYDRNDYNTGFNLLKEILKATADENGVSDEGLDLLKNVMADMMLDDDNFDDSVLSNYDDEAERFRDEIRGLMQYEMANIQPGSVGVDRIGEYVNGEITDNYNLSKAIEDYQDRGYADFDPILDSDAVAEIFSDSETFRDFRIRMDDALTDARQEYERESGMGDGDYESLDISGDHVDYKLHAYNGWNHHDVEDVMDKSDLENAGIDLEDVRDVNTSVYIEWWDDIDKDLVLDRFKERYPDRPIYERGSTQLTPEAEQELTAMGKQMAAFDAIKTFRRFVKEEGRPGMILHNTPIQQQDDVGGMRELLYAKHGFGKNEGPGQFAVIGSDGKVHPINGFSKEEMERLKKSKQELRGERNKEKAPESVLNQIRRRARETDQSIRERKPELNDRLDSSIGRIPGGENIRRRMNVAMRPTADVPRSQDLDNTLRVRSFIRYLGDLGFDLGNSQSMTREERFRLNDLVGQDRYGPVRPISNGEETYYIVGGNVVDKDGNNVIPKNYDARMATQGFGRDTNVRTGRSGMNLYPKRQ